MTYSAHPDAERDVEIASDFYRDRAGVLLALKFVAEVDRIAKLVDCNPEAGAPLTHGRRMFHRKTFPYTLVYRPQPGGIQVLVVRHQHQKPGYGMRRG